MFVEIREKVGCFMNIKEVINGRTVWTSRMMLRWPFSVLCYGQGVTKQAAEQHASVEAFIKLKVINIYLIILESPFFKDPLFPMLLNDEIKTACHNFFQKLSDHCIKFTWPQLWFNNVVITFQSQGHVSGLNDFYIQHRTIKPVKNQPVDMVLIDPDYEIYVDASIYGYGGYLIDKRNIDCRGRKVRWFQEAFPSTPDFSEKFKLHTNFLEYYGIVCCVFTWKKKFEGKRVLCRTDNATAVSLINSGLRVNRQPERQYMRKLFLVC